MRKVLNFLKIEGGKYEKKKKLLNRILASVLTTAMIAGTAPVIALAAGKIEGSYCSVCGTVLKKQVTVPKFTPKIRLSVTKRRSKQRSLSIWEYQAW